MPVFVPRLPTDPVLPTKSRVNQDDLENPRLPVCDKRFWIVDGAAVREMTTAEKLARGFIEPSIDTQPKKWSKQTILTIESCPPYYIGRGVEESITIQPQASQDKLFVRVKKIIQLKTDLRAVVTADPATWALSPFPKDGVGGLQERLDEVLGWAN